MQMRATSQLVADACKKHETDVHEAAKKNIRGYFRKNRDFFDPGSKISNHLQRWFETAIEFSNDTFLLVVTRSFE